MEELPLSARTRTRRARGRLVTDARPRLARARHHAVGAKARRRRRGPRPGAAGREGQPSSAPLRLRRERSPPQTIKNSFSIPLKFRDTVDTLFQTKEGSTESFTSAYVAAGGDPYGRTPRLSPATLPLALSVV